MERFVFMWCVFAIGFSVFVAAYCASTGSPGYAAINGFFVLWNAWYAYDALVVMRG